MKKNFLAGFLDYIPTLTNEEPEVKPEVRVELAGRDSTHLIETPVSVFDTVNRHLGELIEAEARARVAHQQSLAELAKFKADMKAQYEAQVAAIKALFPGDNDE